jgi:Rieske 2Fe-2S family protein
MAHNTNSLPGEYFTSPVIHNDELSNIFYRRWLCVGRADRVAKSGDYFLQTIGSESVIVVRDQAGKVNAFFNLCRHRGTRICTEETGAFSKSIQCPYHAWTYGLDGKLIGVPDGHDMEGLDKATLGLHKVAIQEWQGFLFINLSRNPGPLLDSIGSLAGRVERWGLPNLKIAGQIVYDVAANWKLVVENYNECYHCPIIHPQLNERSNYRSGVNDLNQGVVLGGYMMLAEGAESMSLEGGYCAPPLDNIDVDDLSRVYYYSIFPNMMLSLHPDYVMFHTLWPQGPERTQIVCEWLFSPEAMSAPDFSPAGAISFWDETNRQDWHVCELSQMGVRSIAYQPGPYHFWHESLLAEFDQQVLNALGHTSPGAD